jgi:hypothetical protein
LYSTIAEFESDITTGLTDVHTFGVIITDQHFDDSDTLGTQLAEDLRKKYAYKGIVIGCSGDDCEQKFTDAGANIFWSKPPPSNDEIVRGLIFHFNRFSIERSKSCLIIPPDYCDDV